MHQDRSHRVAVMTVGLLLTVLALPAVVAAHAELQATSPEAGSTVEVPLELVTATFSEALVASKSSIEVDIVLDIDVGRRMATGGLDPADPRTLAVTFPPLAPADYRVFWTAATDDGHIERGQFDFTVAEPPSPAPTSPPTPSAEPAVTAAPAAPSATPTATVAPSPAPDGSGGAESIGQILVIAVVGVALGLGIGWWRSRRAA